MVYSSLISELKSIKQSTSKITRPAKVQTTYPNLSLRQFHDKIIVKTSSKMGGVRCKQIVHALFAYDPLGLSLDKFDELLFSEDGAVIAGITYKLKVVVDSTFLWLVNYQNGRYTY